MPVKFGPKQFKNPTPTKLGNGIQIFTVVAAIVLAWLGTATANFIPLKESGITQSILGLLIGIANGLKPFFGVETTQKEVPIENVSGMDESK